MAFSLYSAFEYCAMLALHIEKKRYKNSYYNNNNNTGIAQGF